MKEAGIKVDNVLEFDVPDALIVERIVGRRCMCRRVGYTMLPSTRRKWQAKMM